MHRCALATLLGLGFALLILAAPGLAQPPDQPALVRVNLSGPEDLARVDALGLPALAHLAAPGAEYLLAVLTPRQRDQLRALGLALTVLDPDAADAAYYLIESGQPGMAERVAPAFAVVHDDGRQAVGRRREGVTLRAVEGLGVRLAHLGPDPVVLAPPVTGDITTTPTYDPLIADLLGRITTDTVAGYDGGLSGEWPVPVGGQPYRLTTRYTYSGEPIARATQYVYEHMQALGYDVRYHEYTLSGYALRNVVGEKRGLAYPDRIVLLTAHLDSRAADWPHDPAPGADDNGSGAAALMVAADLLAPLDFDYTVRIVFFTGEEQGMWGSYYYARDAAGAGEDILGVLNLDMIAWDAEAGPDVDLHSHTLSVEDDSDALADLLAAVVDVYGLGLEPQIVENGARFSDHSRFWDRGYAAVLAIEDYYNPSEEPYEPRDWNPNYHTASDRLSTLNLAYFREYARAGLAAFAHLAVPIPTTISGTVMEVGTAVPLSATVTALGRRGAFSGTTDVSGTYAVLVRPGLYTVTASAFGYSAQKVDDVSVLTGTATRVDFELEPLPTYVVSGTMSDAANDTPLSATIQFDDDYTVAAPTGVYSVTVFSGTYLVTASAPFHHPMTRTVVVDRDQRQDFALQPMPCVLVVDDDYDSDGNPYDDQAYYTRTLRGLGVGYDLWAVEDDEDGPPLDALRRYRGVIWLTGRDWDYTLTSADQDALTEYLEGGGRLFVSGQDIGWDVARNGEPPFYRDYLHADYLRDDSGYHELIGVDFMSGLTVTIQGGDGADNQDFPSDVAVVGDGVGLFRYPDGDWGAVAYADETYRVVYFAFGFEGINSGAARHSVMERVLRYLAPCSLPPSYDLALQGAGIRFGEPGEAVTHTVAIVNTGARGDAYDLALGGPVWTSTLPFTHTPLLLPRQHISVPLVVTIPPDAAIGDRDQVTLTATSTYSPVHVAQIVLRTAVGQHVYLPLICREWQPPDTMPEAKPSSGAQTSEVSAAASDSFCDPLPPPAGDVVHVYPSQASELDGIVQAAAAGDTILLHDGTYDLHGEYLWFDTPGVTLRSASGDRDSVVIDGHYETAEIVHVCASDVTIADLTLKRAMDHPIHVAPPDDADIENTLIYNVHILDPGQQAIKINQNSAMTHFPDRGRVACSHIELTDAGRRFVLQYNGSCYTGGVDGHQAWGWVIQDNVIQGFWCSEGLAEHAVHFWTGSRDTLVERNVLLDNARGVGFGLLQSGDGRVYDDGPCPGPPYVGHYDGVVRNNFVFAGQDELLSSQYGFDCGICLAQACGAQVVHNTVASTQPPFSSVEWRFSATDAQITNNLVTHNLRRREGGSATLAGNLEYAPLSLFVDGAGGDLHLAEGANSAIDRGFSIPEGRCDDDIDGHPRPWGGGRDIGADEVYGFDLSASRKTVEPTRAGAGEMLAYTILLRNTGSSSAADVVLFDAIPAHTTYVPDSVHATSGVATDADGIGWTGIVSPYGAVTVTFRVTVEEGVPIENTAVITDPLGTRTVLKAWTNARLVYLPLVLR